jgi:hypothetical protein
MVVCACSYLVVAAALRFGKTKTPPPVWQWGLIKLLNESEPDRNAAQPQRVQQQIQIQMAIHGHKIHTPPRWVKLIFTLASAQPSPGHWLRDGLETQNLGWHHGNDRFLALAAIVVE